MIGHRAGRRIADRLKIMETRAQVIVRCALRSPTFPVSFRGAIACVMAAWSLPLLQQTLAEGPQGWARSPSISNLFDCEELAKDVTISFRFRNDDRPGVTARINEPLLVSKLTPPSKLIVSIGTQQFNPIGTCRSIKVHPDMGRFVEAGMQTSAISEKPVVVSHGGFFDELDLTKADLEMNDQGQRVFPNAFFFVYEFDYREYVRMRSYTDFDFKYEVSSSVADKEVPTGREVAGPVITFNLGYDFKMVDNSFKDAEHQINEAGELVHQTRDSKGWVMLSSLYRAQTRDSRMVYAAAIFATSIALFVDVAISLVIRQRKKPIQGD